MPPSTARTDYSNVVAPFSAGGMDAAVALSIGDEAGNNWRLASFVRDHSCAN